MTFPYHIVVEDFNNDGIDDAFVGSFGAPRMREDNTNYNVKRRSIPQIRRWNS